MPRKCTIMQFSCTGCIVQARLNLNFEGSSGHLPFWDHPSSSAPVHFTSFGNVLHSWSNDFRINSYWGSVHMPRECTIMQVSCTGCIVQARLNLTFEASSGHLPFLGHPSSSAPSHVTSFGNVVYSL